MVTLIEPFVSEFLICPFETLTFSPTVANTLHTATRTSKILSVQYIGLEVEFYLTILK
jgi:hypothetical protein